MRRRARIASTVSRVEAVPAVATRGLSKAFGPHLALDGLDLDVPAGSIFGLVGVSGAGKTTALRLMAGLARPTGGSVAIAGRPMANGGEREARRRLGVLDQSPRFYSWMTGRELLAFVADLFGVPRSAVGARVDEGLERVGMSQAADRRVGGYSMAERQRIGLAQALIGEPEVLLLDEPVGSVDPAARADLLRIVRALRGSATVVMSGADPEDIEPVCDRVALLDAGRLVVDARVDALVGGVKDTAYVIELDRGSGVALAGLVARLRKESWVRDASTDRGLLRVLVRDEGRAAHELLPAIVATGVSVSTFRRQRPSLRDAVAELLERGRADTP
jgi:ABC-2 type transport system ATP-binding protein